jgi:SPP1 family predicted phage head-tail adaptor
MDIAALNLRITFQKQVTDVDEYGNHTNHDDDYITCWATASGSGTEADEAGTTNPKETIDFTTRWCEALSKVTIRRLPDHCGREALQHPLRESDGL